MEVLAPADLAKQAKQAYQDGDYETASKTFNQAAEAFTNGGDALNAAEMKNNLSVVLLQMGDAQGALDALQKTVDVFVGANDLRRQALALGNKAAAHEALGQLDEAAGLYEKSANMLGDLKEKELRASVLKSLSALQLKRGKPFDAVSAMKEGLNEVEKPSWGQRLLRKILAMRLW